MHTRTNLNGSIQKTMIDLQVLKPLDSNKLPTDLFSDHYESRDVFECDLSGFSLISLDAIKVERY
jgi:hypothetical protein